MSKINELKKWLKAQKAVQGLYYSTFGQTVVAPLWHYLTTSPKKRRLWHQRIRAVLASEDNEYIARDAHAGKIVDGNLVMHNGIKVSVGSYYGYPMTRMLQLNRGVHEPQEERVFQAILPYMPEGAVMIELGAYWAFYSIWFGQSVKGATCYMIEPDKLYLTLGVRNCCLNGVVGVCTHAFVGARPGVAANGVKVVTVDGFVAEHGIEYVHVLHSDIQGSELDMLRGAERTIHDRRVGYLFISTHSNELHYKCKARLEGDGFVILASHNLDESYSCDGLVVARAPDCPGPERVPISYRDQGS